MSFILGRRPVTAMCLLFGLLSGIGNAENSSDNGVDIPKDFAYGIPLTVEGRAPFYQLNLPNDVYMSSVWPDLRDVRIFNGKGDPVPFALVENVSVDDKKISTELNIFPLRPATGRGTKSNAASPTISYRTASGLNVTFPIDSTQATAKTSFLLVRPENEKKSVNIDKLRIEWREINKSWQGKVTVFGSDDLKTWSELASNMPLMELISGDQRLRLNDIDLTGSYARTDSRYLLLEFNDSENLPIQLLQVQGFSLTHKSEQKTLSLEMSGQKISASEAQYSWPTPQPMHSLGIVPTTENAVLPVQIEYRSAEKESWRRLENKVIYRSERGDNPVIPMEGKIVQAIRIKGINYQWNDDLPKVNGFRDTYTLIFNAQGNEPYLLAWGAKNATHRALGIRDLLPSDVGDPQRLPSASFVQSRMELGGSDRLTTASHAERTHFWQQLTLWGLLLLGTAGLSVLALKVWREVQQKT